MRSFLLEMYLPTRDQSELEALALRAHAIERAQVIRHLGSLVLLEDEICFHIFEAPSAAALLAASEEAGLSCERVTEAVWAPGSA